ncbi:ankyrin repeat protein [Swinepox virus]|uniref:Ankyrin repeat protein n=1 Tax=Swinepox virus TaxID=10276 RepID=A0A881SY80_SWPV|nr:ankyrin repeat protein [Swinepox virus]
MLYDYIAYTKSRNITLKYVLNILDKNPKSFNDYRYKHHTICEYMYKRIIKLDVLELLLKTGINPRSNRMIDSFLSSILSNEKIKQSHVKNIIQILLKHGARFYKKAYYSHPLFYLITNTHLNHASIFEYLSNMHINFNIKRPDGYNLLHIYLESCNDIKLNILKILIDNKVKINAKTRLNRFTPLQVYLSSSSNIRYTVIRFLVENGADINYGYLETPLYTFFSHCDDIKKLKKITKYLINMGADINQRSVVNNNTPIVGFVMNSLKVNVDSISFIIDTCGADPLITNGDNNTLLHIYLDRYIISLNVLSLLLNRGININHVNRLNLTPLHMYIDKDAEYIYIIIIKYLISKGAMLSRTSNSVFAPSVLEIFLRNNRHLYKISICLVNYLLTLYPIDVKDEYGFTPLLSAVYTNNIEFFNYFIDLGSDINVVSEFGDTCITIAVYNENKYFLNSTLRCHPNISMLKASFNYFINKDLDSRIKNKMMEDCIRYVFTLDPDTYLDYPYICTNFTSVIEECKKDIIRMKNTHLRNVSVYDLVFNSNNTMNIRYVYTEEVNMFVSSKLYGNKVRRTIINSIEKYDNIKYLLLKINNICTNTIWNILPTYVHEKILDCMTLNDIKMLYSLFNRTSVKSLS